MIETATSSIRKGKTNGYNHSKADAKRNRKRQEAEARQREWDATPLEEKLKLMGKKHRARWDKQQAELAKRKVATPAPVVAEIKPVKADEGGKKQRQSKKKVIEVAKMERPSKS